MSSLARPANLTQLPRQPVLLTLALTLLSLGLYLPIWFLRRRAALEALGGSVRLNRWLLWSVLAVYGIDALLSLLSWLVPGLEQGLSLIEPYAFWIDLSCSLALLWQCFKVKGMLQEAWDVRLNPIYTLLFMHFYLQNWMNHLRERARQ